MFDNFRKFKAHCIEVQVCLFLLGNSNIVEWGFFSLLPLCEQLTFGGKCKDFQESLDTDKIKCGVTCYINMCLTNCSNCCS